MSGEAMTWVVPLRGIGAIPKAVLFALADFADDEGACTPTIADLVGYVDADAKSVLAAIKALSDLNLIEETAIRKGTALLGYRYRVLMDRPLDPRVRVVNVEARQ